MYTDDTKRASLLSDPDDALWTRNEVAAVLRVHPKTVDRMPGLIRTEMLGRGRRGMVRYLAGDVRKYAQQCRRTGEDRVA